MNLLLIKSNYFVQEQTLFWKEVTKVVSLCLNGEIHGIMPIHFSDNMPVQIKQKIIGFLVRFGAVYYMLEFKGRFSALMMTIL